MQVLAELARTAPDQPKDKAPENRRDKVTKRPVTAIPEQFIGTAQGELIRKLDAMTRDPDLPLAIYGRAHAALRKALKGDAVDTAFTLQ